MESQFLIQNLNYEKRIRNSNSILTVIYMESQFLIRF